MKSSVENANELDKERSKALHTKIDAFKWSLVLIAIFTVISLGGFVTLAVYLVNKLIGG